MGTKGIIPRLSEELFKEIEFRRSTEGYNAIVHVDYVEIYGTQEKLSDLLAEKDVPLKIKQGTNKQFLVDGLSMYQPHNASEMELFIRIGSERRSTSGTEMNHASSRSHALFTITLTQTFGGGETTRTSRIKLVDLAGSENLNKSKATGQRQQEATAINSALSSLKRVLTALVNKSTHVPFRDSALTKLLADSLGGNSRTTMVATVSPSVYNLSETKSTLTWACRARKIKNTATVNEDNDKRKVKTLEDEVELLKKQLKALASGGGVPSAAVAKELEKLKTVLEEKQSELMAEVNRRREREEEFRRVEEETAKRLRALQDQFTESQANLGNARGAWNQLSMALSRAEEDIASLRRENEELQCQHNACVECQLEEREFNVAHKEYELGTIAEQQQELLEWEERLMRMEAMLENQMESLAQQEADLKRRECAHAEERDRFMIMKASHAPPVRQSSNVASKSSSIIGMANKSTSGSAARRQASMSSLGISATSGRSMSMSTTNAPRPGRPISAGMRSQPVGINQRGSKWYSVK
eukprot:GFYU01009873.1.p1 GENE.GFYU01009873.1~~GFYU01009873.1.p1  ORF type:complete len:553 (+),score=154.13 GFYU01009873.1:72-1661(+)